MCKIIKFCMIYFHSAQIIKCNCSAANVKEQTSSFQNLIVSTYLELRFTFERDTVMTSWTTVGCVPRIWSQTNTIALRMNSTLHLYRLVSDQLNTFCTVQITITCTHLKILLERRTILKIKAMNDLQLVGCCEPPQALIFVYALIIIHTK